MAFDIITYGLQIELSCELQFIRKVIDFLTLAKESCQ